jgi:hypothetical protein
MNRLTQRSEDLSRKFAFRLIVCGHEKTLPLRGRVEFLLAFGCSPENTISSAYAQAGVNQQTANVEVKLSCEIFLRVHSSFRRT